MKAIVLAAGYATRLSPLTDSVAKPLLPLAGRPLIDYVCDELDTVDAVDEVHVVTNARFAGDFSAWAENRDGRLPIRVHDDGTTSNEDRLGAIGDIQFTIEHGGLAGEDLLIVAGDNLFEFALTSYVHFWRTKGDASCIALYECPEPELVKQYGVVEVDSSDRVVSFAEKPEQPQSNLVSIAVYLYRARHAALFDDYLAAGNSPDQPGRLVEWLHTRVPIYGFRFQGEWLDIGDHRQLLEADNLMRKRAGLAPRAEYALS